MVPRFNHQTRVMFEGKIVSDYPITLRAHCKEAQDALGAVYVLDAFVEIDRIGK